MIPKNEFESILVLTDRDIQYMEDAELSAEQRANLVALLRGDQAWND